MSNYRETSGWAWADWEGVISDTLDNRILSVLLAYNPHGGIICEHIEEILDAKHQSVSGNLRHLCERGFVYPSGNYDETRSGRTAIKWLTTLAPGDAFPEPEPRQPNTGGPQPMTGHSPILGGSTADRLIRCPSSYQLSLKAPVEDVVSPYAEQGTRLHSAIAHCITHKISPKRLHDGFDWGFWEDGSTISPEENEILAVALDALEELKQRYGGKFRLVSIEKWLPLPNVTGAGGTADLILVNAEFVLLVDWKFGGGVMVPILKDEADGTQSLLAQAAFYLCCARAAYPRRFKGRRIIGAIIQPRAEQPLSETETDDVELDGFLDAFKFAYDQAISREPPIERGDHCRFARCKVVCPLWTAPVFDLTAIDPTAIQLQASQSPEAGRGYGGFLATALDLAGFAEDWAAEVRRQAHVYLEGGGVVDGWKLVPKRGARKWLDDEYAALALAALGAEDEDIWTEPEVRSVAQVEKALKKRGVEIPAELWHSVSTGTTIAPADDGRPASNEAEVVDELRKALTAL